MTCSEALATLQRIEKLLTKEQWISELYDGLVSSVGTRRKGLFDDDTGLPSNSLFTRLTVKVRSMGTNTYIALGDRASPNIRLTSISESKTYVAPIKNNNVVPFKVGNLTVLGDGADGVLEIDGVRIEKAVIV